MEGLLRRIRISKRIFLFYFFLSFFPVLVIGILNYVSSSRILKEKVSQYGIQTAHDAVRSLNIRIDKMDDHMIDLAYGSKIQDSFDQLYVRESFPDFVSFQIQKTLEEDFYIKELQILAARIILKNPENGTFFREYLVDPQNLMDEYTFDGQYLRQIYNAHGRPVWKPLELIGGFSSVTPKGTRVKGFLISRTISRLETGKKIGTLSLFVSADYLLEPVTTLNREGKITLIDPSGHTAFSTDPGLMETGFGRGGGNIPDLKEGSSFLGLHSVWGERSLVFSSGPAVNGWYVIYTIPYETLIYETRKAGLTTVSFALILLILTAFTTLILSSSILSPLRRLSRLTREVRKGNFDASLEAVGRDEITELTMGYNTMIREVRRLIEEVYQSEIKEKEARLQALRSKINPHFLFNTLDTIRWTARRNQPEETSEQIERLSVLFRMVLEDAGAFWSVRKEVVYVKNYLFFQEIRYSGRVSFRWDVDEDVTEAAVPPMILQPLAENVILHGLPESGPPVTGIIAIGRDGDALVLTVEDDGAGCDPGRVGRSMETRPDGEGTHHNMALKNIRDRIHLRFGKSYGLTLESGPGRGCRVTVRIPYIPWKEGMGAYEAADM